MKTKITYLLLILPLMTFAQGPFNFDTSTEGFTCNSTGGTILGAHTVTQSGGDLSVNFVAGAGTNPQIQKTSPLIDADNTVNYIEIRLKNLSAVSYLRFGVSGANYGNKDITTFDTEYKTYIIDVQSWTGNPIANMQILCKKYNSAKVSGDAYTPVAGEYILIDYIKPLAFLVTPEVNTFNFDATAEGFDKLTRATAVWVTESGKGTLQVKSPAANALATVVALNSIIAHVEGANKYAHVTLKNTTTNTQFQLKGKVATVATAFSPSQTFTTADADYKTYDFDLSTWDSGYQFPELNFAVKDNWSATGLYAINDQVISSNSTYKNLTGINTANAPRADISANAAAVPPLPQNWELVGTEGALLDITNSIYIDAIVFDNVAPNLGTNDLEFANNTISLYPNPVQEVLSVNSENPIVKIEVYDMLGRKVASNNNAKNVNVAALGKGVYIVKVVQENGSVVAKQFIKQ